MSLAPEIGAVAAVFVGGWSVAGHLTAPRDVASTPAGASPPRRGRRVARRQRRGLVVVGLLVASLVEPIISLSVGVGIVLWPPVRRVVRQRQQRQLVAAAVPDAIELLILMIHAGLTPHQAVRASVTQSPEPIRPGFAEVERRLDRGQALADALRGLPEVLGPALDPVADTLAIAERYGTPIGDALAQLSSEVRQQRRRLAEADARKLPVRLSFPLVCCTLPSFVLVAIAPAVIAALSSLGDTTW